MGDETNIAGWPRLSKQEDLIIWAGQITDRLRYIDNWIVTGRTLKPRNPNWIVEGGGGGTQGPPGPTGPMGPQGPAGDPGVGAYRHVQTTAATVWTINHGLSFRPNVSAIDSTGREMIPGAVDYTTATSVTLTFSAAVGGEAYLS